jgi:hypothetical protein
VVADWAGVAAVAGPIVCAIAACADMPHNDTIVIAIAPID